MHYVKNYFVRLSFFRIQFHWMNSDFSILGRKKSSVSLSMLSMPCTILYSSIVSPLVRLTKAPNGSYSSPLIILVATLCIFSSSTVSRIAQIVPNAVTSLIYIRALRYWHLYFQYCFLLLAMCY